MRRCSLFISAFGFACAADSGGLLDPSSEDAGALDAGAACLQGAGWIEVRTTPLPIGTATVGVQFRQRVEVSVRSDGVLVEGEALDLTLPPSSGALESGRYELDLRFSGSGFSTGIQALLLTPNANVPRLAVWEQRNQVTQIPSALPGFRFVDGEDCVDTCGTRRGRALMVPGRTQPLSPGALATVGPYQVANGWSWRDVGLGSACAAEIHQFEAGQVFFEP